MSNLQREEITKKVVDRATDLSLWCYVWERAAAIEATDYELRSFCCGPLAEPFTEPKTI